MERDRLVTAHLDLARTIARARSRGKQAHLHDETLGVAFLALVEASRSWDPDGGRNFAGWANIRIHGAISDERRRPAGLGGVRYQRDRAEAAGEEAPPVVIVPQEHAARSAVSTAEEMDARLDVERLTSRYLGERERAVVLDALAEVPQAVTGARFGVSATMVIHIKRDAMDALYSAAREKR